MKAILILFLSSVLCLGQIAAQHLLIREPSTPISVDPNGPEEHYTLQVINTDSIAHILKVEITPQLAQGQIFHFCWDLCYSDGITSSIGALRVKAGDSTSGFQLYFNPMGYEVAGKQIGVRFYDRDDPSISVDYTFRFQDFSTPIDEVFSEQNNRLSIPFPNPANQITQLDYQLPPDIQEASIIVFDAFGKEIMAQSVSRSRTQLSIQTADWAAGLYFVSLRTEGELLSSRKFVVRH